MINQSVTNWHLTHAAPEGHPLAIAGFERSRLLLRFFKICICPTVPDGFLQLNVSSRWWQNIKHAAVIKRDSCSYSNKKTSSLNNAVSWFLCVFWILDVLIFCFIIMWLIDDSVIITVCRYAGPDPQGSTFMNQSTTTAPPGVESQKQPPREHTCQHVSTWQAPMCCACALRCLCVNIWKVILL